MSEQTAQEPTMEEILASIRRIISEDETPAAEAAPAHEPEPAPAPEPEVHHAPAEVAPSMMDETPSMEEDDVLELTDRWEEPAPTPIETVGDIEAHTPQPFEAPRPEPVYEAPRAPAYEPPAETLVSSHIADSAASSFAGLAQQIMMPRNGLMLEDVVKEMMKPMLKQWLDQNLDRIVQEAVRVEVERISRRGAG